MSLTYLPDEHNQPPGLADPGTDPRAWLNDLPPAKRSTVANWFHYAVRNGAHTPHTVCSAVWQTVQRRLEWSADLGSRQFLQGIHDLLRAHQQEALAYAAEVLRYEALPYQQRQRVKAQRALTYLKTSMVGKPATEAQHGLLRRLGYAGELPSDRAVASELIDRLMRQQGGGR